jgi:2-polyprenyl-6-methoxyphenol hydroxylase-like FAD-dependent oxidoreductase
MDIVIAGAGIGGLAAALSLEAAGFREVRIVEAAPEIRPLGVGLNILPNAVRELNELGVFDAAAAQAVLTAELAFYHRSGGLIWSEPRGLVAGHRWPQLSLSRSHLINVLAEAVKAQLGSGVIQTDARMIGFTPLANGRVEVVLEHQRVARTTSIETDLLIGADGLHSAVRANLYPDEGEPCSNGLVMWRGTTWTEPYLTGRTMIVIGDDQKKFVAYPIVPPDESNGLTLINWVTARPSDNNVAQDLDTRRDQALDHFGDWCAPWLNIPALIKKATSILEYPMLDRDPLPRWTSGRVVLLGDAAHPMFPVGSNGATQSIIDGRVLAYALATNDNIDEALASYERERRLPMTKIQETNRRMGPERVIDLAHRRAPNGFDKIDDVISREELEQVSSEYAETAGFTPTILNAHPSYSVLP